ncbi:heterokaryon incompatibility protein Het-C protein [Ceratobasidium sp. AG-Ba]|nr:heterokaryon incompatibility protein Het-C protein [Ceratobasidium sp. AG-Ba]
MSFLVTTLLVTVLLCVLVPHVAAFGAGDIPDYAYLNDKAFRHGDLESILSTLSKNVPAGLGGGVGGILAGVAKMALRGGHGDRFTSLDVKRVYFGNWLRDYSQAMDIAGLSKMTAQTLITVVSALGFMTFGFATEEFEVTADRLGVYLPVEHIDNPKGYAEKEGDARQFHPKLRPPVDPRELEIDQNTGMKNYIATEGQSWDTSTAHVRRTLQACIEHGRLASGNEGGYMWEAFRLLGTALHTLEDLLAHSNWCELGLLKMGHNEVFCHVGDNVKVNTPNGQAPPLITGTFGSADFMHSLLGEATDHLSEASMKNQNQSESPISKLRAVLGRIPSGGGDDKQNAMNQGDEIRNKAFNFNPDDVAPEDVQRQFLEILKWHDQVMHDITKTIQNIPGLESLLEDLTNAMNAYVYTTLEPWLTPILQQATGALQEGSAAVIDTDDQYEVFNNPDASDPSHSLLSKDHFGLILNEPAGKVALVVVKHTVELIVQAWYDESKDVGQTINQVMEAFHHPFYATGNSQVQNNMAEELKRWFDELGSEARLSFHSTILQLLTKESVREGKNKRVGQDTGPTHSGGTGGYSGSHGQQQSGGYGQSGYGQQSYGNQESSTYGSGGGYGSSRNEGESGYGRSGYGNTNDNDNSYSSRHNQGSYGQTEESYGRGGTYGQSTNEYGGSGRTGYGNEEDNSYSSRRNQGSYGQTEESYGSRREESHSGYNPSYNTSESTYSSRREEESSYGRNNDSYGSRGNDEYGGGYGSRREEGSYGQSYGRSEERSYGGGEENSYGGGYSRRDDDEERPRHHGRHKRDDDNEGYGGHQGYNPEY